MADSEYERGFKDGLKSECLKELKPLMVELTKGCTEAIKGITPMLIDNSHLTIRSAANRWISVEDALPEKDTDVIVCCYGSDMILAHDGETMQDAVKRTRRECSRVTIGFIGSDGWYGADWFPMMVSPTYWMPLPEPPEGGAEDE